MKRVFEPVPVWWKRVLRSDPCSYCGLAGGLIEHVYALSRGGPDTDANMVGACLSCNSRKGNRSLVPWLVRFYAPRPTHNP